MSASSPFPAPAFNVTFTENLVVPVDEGSACVVGAAFTTAAGAPFVPASITYRIDDIDSGASVVPATTVTPQQTISIVVTGAQNVLLSDMLACEQHQLILKVTDGSGNQVNAPLEWSVQRIFPSTE